MVLGIGGDLVVPVIILIETVYFILVVAEELRGLEVYLSDSFGLLLLTFLPGENFWRWHLVGTDFVVMLILIKEILEV